MNKLAVYLMPVRKSFPPREFSLRRFARQSALSSSILAVTLWLGLPPRVSCAQELTDPPKTLSVEQLLDERQDDQVEAMALYTHGQLLLRRGDVANALRRFQRAWRFDPQLVSLMDEIVPLAFELERNTELTAYVLLGAESDDVPIQLLRQLAPLLAGQGRFTDALHLYQCYLDRRELVRDDGFRPQNGEDVLALFQVGRLALLTGQFHRSAKAFAAVWEVLEDRTPIRLTRSERAQIMDQPELLYAIMGESFLRDGRWDEAEAVFQAAHEGQEDGSAVLGYRLARVAQGRKRPHQALKHLERYFQSQSAAAGVAAYQLLTELMDGQPANDAAPNADADADTTKSWPDAGRATLPSPPLLKKLRQLRAANPQDTALGYFLAAQLRAAGLLDESERLYTTLLDQEPAADALVGLVDIYVGREDVAALLAMLGQTIASTESLAVLGKLTSKIAGNQRLLEELSDAVDQGSAGPEKRPPATVAMAMAFLHAQAGQFDLAEGFFRQAIAQDVPQRGGYAVEFAFQLLEYQQPQRAAAVFQQLLDRQLLEERTAEIQYYLAGAWTLAGAYQPALQAARAAARQDPESSRFVSRIAWVHYRAQQLAEAERAYLDLLNQFDSDDASENRQVMRDARLTLSTIDVLQQRPASAELWLLEVLDEFPEDIGALNDLGYLWVDQGKHLQRSLRMVRKAVEAEPDNIAYRDSLGWAYYRLEQYDAAVRELRKAASAEPPDGVILDHLGDALLAARQPSEAIKVWRQAVDAFRQTDQLQQVDATQAKIKEQISQTTTP